MAETLWTRADRHIVEVAIAASIVALVAAPVYLSAAVGVGAALVSALLVAAVRFRASAPVARETWVLVGASSLAVGLLALASAMAVDPQHSFFGKFGQHGGAITWISLLALFVVMVVHGRSGDLGRTLRAVAIASGVIALVALADAAGMIDSVRYSEEAAGLLESSISLGQVLVLGTGCALAWALTSNETWQQSVGWAIALVGVVALVAAGARAPLVALVAAGLVVAAVRSLGSGSRSAMISWGAALAAAAVVVIALGWFLIGPTNLERAEEWASATNRRTVIWSSAYAAAAQSPLIGRGPDQFSAWAVWNSDPQVGLSKAGTYDPHSVPLSWLVAGGLVGLLACGVALGLGLGRMFVTFSDRTFAWPVGAVLVGLLGWAFSLTTAWMAPLAAYMAVLVFSGLISAGDRSVGGRIAPRIQTQALTSFTAVVCVAALVFWAPILGQEMAWASEAREESVDVTGLHRLAEESQDPSAAAIVVNTLVQEAYQREALAQPNIAMAEALEPVLQDAAEWHVDAAYAGTSLSVLRMTMLGQGAWEDVDAYIQAGKLADPASGLWDYVGAVQAERLGTNEDAAAYAAEALKYPLPENARAYMEGIAPAQ